MLSQFRYSFQNQRQAVMEKLALGATIKLASLPIIQQSVKTGWRRRLILPKLSELLVCRDDVRLDFCGR